MSATRPLSLSACRVVAAELRKAASGYVSVSSTAKLVSGRLAMSGAAGGGTRTVSANEVVSDKPSGSTATSCKVSTKETIAIGVSTVKRPASRVVWVWDAPLTLSVKVEVESSGSAIRGSRLSISVSPPTIAVSAIAAITGAWLTRMTSTAIVSLVEAPPASVALNVRVSLPKKFADGCRVARPAAEIDTAMEAEESALQVMAERAWSSSLVKVDRSRMSELPCSSEVSGRANWGGSLTAKISIARVSRSTAKLGSHTVNCTEPDPAVAGGSHRRNIPVVS